MAKCYVGVSGKAKNVKNIYVGVAGKARRVTKAYIGVGGKARLFWAGGSIYKYGTATALSEAKYDFGAAHIGNYALFAAGISTNNSYLKSVETYNASLTKGTAPNLETSNRALGGQNSAYALFLVASATYSYNSSLTVTKRGTATATAIDGTSLSFNDYIMFVGGHTSATGKGIDVFDSSMTHSQTGVISRIMLNAAAASVGKYALFAGGRSARTNGNYYSVVEIYDSSLTKLTMSGKSLSVECSSLAGATNKSYAIFTGGFNENVKTINNADVYNTSMTKSIGTSLSVSRADHTGISIDNYAMFIGGRPTTSTYTNAVDIYDSSLTRTTNSISSNRGCGAGTIIGNKAIFAGGQSRDTGTLAATTTVDVFAV